MNVSCHLPYCCGWAGDSLLTALRPVGNPVRTANGYTDEFSVNLFADDYPSERGLSTN